MSSASSTFSLAGNAARRLIPFATARSPRTDLPVDTFEAGDDIEAQRRLGVPPSAPGPRLKPADGLSRVRPAVYAVVGASAYVGVIYLWYLHRIGQARPAPYRFGDTENAGHQARLLAALAPFAGSAAMALEAYVPRLRHGCAASG